MVHEQNPLSYKCIEGDKNKKIVHIKDTIQYLCTNSLVTYRCVCCIMLLVKKDETFLSIGVSMRVSYKIIIRLPIMFHAIHCKYARLFIIQNKSIFLYICLLILLYSYSNYHYSGIPFSWLQAFGYLTFYVYFLFEYWVSVFIL